VTIGRKNKPRILLTEGSSLSARETITALGLAGYRVSLCDPDPLCLGRFSRFVVRRHACPAVGRDPPGYVRTVASLLANYRYDVLMPVHEQAYVLAKHADALPRVNVALASVASFDRVQSKVALAQTLRELSLPQPFTRIATCAADLCRECEFPYYVKTALGTASGGVTLVRDEGTRDTLARRLDAGEAFTSGVVVQQPARGRLERVQALFEHGQLVAIHAYRQVREAIRGGDVLKESVRRGIVREQMEGLGRFLTWHGALSLDYFWGEDQKPCYIDANPRLVEPMNATFSGANLAEILLRVSLGDAPRGVTEGVAGVRTRLTLMAALTHADKTRSRLASLCETVKAILARSEYAGTREELTPVGLDPYSALPLAIVVGRVLIQPGAARSIAGRSVESYAIAAGCGG
jgi:hypothetical protein